MSFLELSLNFPQWDVGEFTVRFALKKRGYERCLPRGSPPLSETTKICRRAWAEEHLPWHQQQWSFILWSDETWINDGPTMPSRVTRKVCHLHSSNQQTFILTDPYREVKIMMTHVL